MIVDKINKYISSNGKTVNEEICNEVSKLAGWAFKRQFFSNDEPASKGTIRLSSCGRCPRQIAYAYHGIEKKGKEQDSRSKMVFWLGDLVELTVINLAKAAGVNLEFTGLNQITVKFSVNGTEIEGHPDGICIDEEKYLLEVKSMTSYGFEKFEAGEIDDGYVAQVNAYMESLGLTWCVFVAINKESGVMHEKILIKDPAIIEKIRKSLVSVLQSTTEKLPEAPYKPNEKGLYPWNCLYCSWWGKCHPTAEKVLIGKSYKLKEPQPIKTKKEKKP